MIKFSKRICERRHGSLFQYNCLLAGAGPVHLGEVFQHDLSDELGSLHSVVKYTQSATLVQVVNDLIGR